MRLRPRAFGHIEGLIRLVEQRFTGLVVAPGGVCLEGAAGDADADRQRSGGEGDSREHRSGGLHRAPEAFRDLADSTSRGSG